MAKGDTPYVSDSEPMVTADSRILTRGYWKTFFDSLTAEAFALINLATDVVGRLLLSNFATAAPNTFLAGNGIGVDTTFRAVNVGTADITGDLPFANLVPATAPSVLVGRGSLAGAGDFQEITLGSGVTMTGTVLSAAGAGGTVTGPGTTVVGEIALFGNITGTSIVSATGTGAVYVTAGVFSVVTASGTWTPTLTNTTNLDGSTPFVSQWSRAGNVVTFSGRVDMDPTATGDTVLGMSLPIASNFASDVEAGGTFVNAAVASECGGIFADATNDRLTFQFQALSTTSQSFRFSGSYLIV